MQPSLFDALEDRKDAPPDQAARDFSIDPSNDVVLEASAGTGKTRVLVDRYVQLIERGVDPRHILAVTFTRKAAAEMRDRVLVSLRHRAATEARMAERWAELRERIADIQISTIDAFCFSLLREFPLEARVDPAFEIADETEMARYGREAVDLTLRAARGLIVSDENVRLLFARVKLGPLRDAIQSVLDRRQMVIPAVASFVRRRVRFATSTEVGAAFLERLRRIIEHSPHAATVLGNGPVHSAEFRWLREDLLGLVGFADGDAGRIQQLQRRLQRYFLTDAGKPRAQVAKRFGKDQFASPDAKRRHDPALKALSPDIAVELDRLHDDVQGLLARGLQRVLAIAVRKYEELLDERAILDFSGMLHKAVVLLGRQEEFARSRLKLQARYHHVLVDEFQDTNRLQWQLVALLIDAWGEGEGVQDAPTSIFVVGDRKQSIYRFRQAEVTLLDEVARKIALLRPGRVVRQAISHSFRAVPELLAFVNALCGQVQGDETLDECFAYRDADQFPVPEITPGATRDGAPVLGIIAERSMEASAKAVATEVSRLLAGAVVRDRAGIRPARPDDVALLFRARTGHQFFQSALEALGIRTYVYKGLGFFDAPEVQDLQALLRYLAEPESDLRAAELLRSRLVRISDVGLARLGPQLAKAVSGTDFDTAAAGLDAADRDLLERVRRDAARWLRLSDRVSPSALVDSILADSAYAFELRGRRASQAFENLKKMRTLVRRTENQGYATLGRLTEYFETLRAGDESHAVIEAAGCVSLMTIHASKGLEFPIVFIVNLQMPGKGRSSAFSIIERGPDGESEVAFGSSEGTKLEDRREREELRRLLYVAITRAKDRLYLAADVDETQGRIRRGPRSLAALLPATLGDLFAAAAASSDGDSVSWDTAAGTFAFRVCRPGAACETEPVPVESHAAVFDLVPIRPIGSATVAATAAAAGEAVSGPLAESLTTRSEFRSDRLLGTLVHRLFQQQPEAGLSESALAELVRRMLRSEELVDVGDVAALGRAAVSLYLRLRRRPDVEVLLAEGECFYEVPFSFRPASGAGAVVRGRLDCLVVRPDGRTTIVEFKTGALRPEHDSQVELYREALSAILPSDAVDIRIISLDDAPPDGRPLR